MSSRLFSSTFSTAQEGGASAFAQSVKGLLASGASGLEFLADDAENFLRTVWVPPASKLQFQVDGALMQASYGPEADGFKLQFWSVLGYLPFSVESCQRRRMLISILDATRSLRQAKFGVTRDNQIIVTQTVAAPDIQPPPFIFISLIPFLQEAMPFMRLIGECL